MSWLRLRQRRRVRLMSSKQAFWRNGWAFLCRRRSVRERRLTTSWSIGGVSRSSNGQSSRSWRAARSWNAAAMPGSRQEGPV